MHRQTGSIIVNDTVLLPKNYANLPLTFRKAENERIHEAINDLLERRCSGNLFVHGPSGSGKTSMVKWALNQTEASGRAVCLYANCWRYSTSMSIYAKIADAFGEPVSRRGRASDEIFDRIVDLMKISKRPVLLVLDEMEALVQYDNARILHNIARVDDERVHFGVIGISEKKNLLSRLPQNTREILRFTEIEIPPYSRGELLHLLKEQAMAGLKPGTYNDALIEGIADIGMAANGSSRFALDTLWKVARHSEDNGLNSIPISELEPIRKHLEMENAELSSEETTIVDLLKDGPKSSSRLYSLLWRRISKTNRQIRNYLHSLEAKGIIETNLVQDRYNFGLKIIRLNEGWLNGQ